MSNTGFVQELEGSDAMFVQFAADVEKAGDRILLHSITPSTLFFSAKPRRIAGHISTQEFIDLWGQADDGFATDPPNAVLRFSTAAGAATDNIVVEISDPVLRGDDLSYAIEVLEGSLPDRKLNPCTLFIDPFGRTLRPVSGTRRRPHPSLTRGAPQPRLV